MGVWPVPCRTDLLEGKTMTDRAWAAVRAAAEQLVRKQRDNSGHGRDGHLDSDDLAPLLLALGLPTDDGPPRRPDTWITVQGAYAWWTAPAGETDPDKADVWIATLEPDGQPDYDNAYQPEDADNWESFPWEDHEPTAAEMRKLKEHIIAALGFLGGGAPSVDPLTEAADRLRAHIAALAADMRPSGNFGTGYESSVRGGLGGVFGDFAAAFTPDVAGSLAALLTAVAAEAPAADIRRLAEQISRSYLEARTNDDERY